MQAVKSLLARTARRSALDSARQQGRRRPRLETRIPLTPFRACTPGNFFHEKSLSAARGLDFVLFLEVSSSLEADSFGNLAPACAVGLWKQCGAKRSTSSATARSGVCRGLVEAVRHEAIAHRARERPCRWAGPLVPQLEAIRKGKRQVATSRPARPPPCRSTPPTRPCPAGSSPSGTRTRWRRRP